MRDPASAAALLLLAAAAAGGARGDDDALQQLAPFVPEVLSQLPLAALRVTVGAKEIDFGTEVTPTEAKEAPAVEWDGEEGAFYMLCLTNPDIPSMEQHIYGELVHWLVVNVPGGGGGGAADGDAVHEYLSPGPPKHTGAHRYLLVVLKQPGRLEVDEARNNATTLDDRFHFSLEAFADKHDLQRPALAANFFQASWDPTVDELAQIRTFRGQIVATIHP